MAEASVQSFDPTKQFQEQTGNILSPIKAAPLKDRADLYKSAEAELLPQQIQAGVNPEREK